MSIFPKILSSQFAYDMSQVILDGFNRHDRIFREGSLEAKQTFESQHWVGIHQLITSRIDYYLDRMKRCFVYLADGLDAINLDSEIGQQVKLHKGIVPDLFSDPQHFKFINKSIKLSNERISE